MNLSQDLLNVVCNVFVLHVKLQELKKLDKPKCNPTSFALFVKAQELERGDAPLSVSVTRCYSVT